MKNIAINPLSAKAFSNYGDVIEREGAQNFEINNGLCTRFHDLANIEVTGPEGRPMISIISGQPYKLPLTLTMVERHPLGSQAFIPLSDNPFLIVVCDDDDGTPGLPRAFITADRQGVNIRRNVWHGILTPLDGISDFVVVDRGGEGNNLEEHFFDEPFVVEV
jgi:ureidoglycolate lyase